MTTGEGTEGGEKERKVLRFHGPTGQPKVAQEVLADLNICFFSQQFCGHLIICAIQWQDFLPLIYLFRYMYV